MMKAQCRFARKIKPSQITEGRIDIETVIEKVIKVVSEKYHNMSPVKNRIELAYDEKKNSGKPL